MFLGFVVVVGFVGLVPVFLLGVFLLGVLLVGWVFDGVFFAGVFLVGVVLLGVFLGAMVVVPWFGFVGLLWWLWSRIRILIRRLLWR
jgi:hypothetical protein